MTKTSKLSHIPLPCLVITLLSACGGGSSGYDVSTNAGTGGSISPSGASVAPGGMTTFNVEPKNGYVITSVTGCGGTLAGSTYTTGTINANCTVTASFSAVFNWVGGSATAGATGVYGMQGAAAETNVPPARDRAVGWTDTNGNLWLFSGYLPSSEDQLNDLWEYSPSTQEWTWVGGSNTTNSKGVYGALGVAATTNQPGARDSAVSWTDGSDNAWVFGGYGYDSSGTGDHYMNDLWEYSPSSADWTWVAGLSTGDASGLYGAQGAAPGGRCCASTWTDADGNLWMFGGYGHDAAGNVSELNDLWEYSPSSQAWTWVGGSNMASANGVYGMLGVAAKTNVPGARDFAVSWTDTDGNLWLFGGYGYDSTGTDNFFMNDLWEYSPSSGDWTWVAGLSTGDAKGVYGTQGVGAGTNQPGARCCAVSWTDAYGNLWLFGGYGYDSTGTALGFLNDLWKYSPSSQEWTWVSGSSTANAKGVYSSTAASTNVPGARELALSLTDPNDNLWLFGGYGYDSTGAVGALNDLWKYPTQ